MALNTSIIVDVYNFDGVGNYFVNKQQQSIPLPAQFVKAVSPDSRVYVYSKILYQMPNGLIQEAYTAETVAQLQAKSVA
jgi:hypothetical protein